MDPKLLYWTAAFANLGLIVFCVTRGVRHIRAHDVRAHRRMMFAGAGLIGLFLVVVSYFNFRPSPINLTLLAAFAAYNGLILFFIAAMNNPFADPVALEPAAFVRLHQELSGTLPETQ